MHAMQNRHSIPSAAALLLACALLGACGPKDSNADADAGHPAVETLPAPSGASGSITGMPDTPGPGNIEPSGDVPAPPVTVLLPEDADVAIAGSDAANPETTGVDVPAAEPTAEDAVALVRNYYAAIESRDYDRAYVMWADGANRQTPEQFAAGFATTAHVAATIDAPGRMEAAAGSRYIEIPVAIESAQQDGSVRRYVGAYSLRRAVVDGATPEQRQWRIASADIREVVQ
jgi:hypothetical protein